MEFRFDPRIIKKWNKKVRSLKHESRNMVLKALPTIRLKGNDVDIYDEGFYTV